MRVSRGIEEARICELEHRIDLLEERVERFESHPWTGVESSEAVEPSAAPGGLGAEYWIGARLLPRVGAIVIILAIAFVAISETSKIASLDRSVLLGLEALICLGFIVVGEWRRDESEGFGRTLAAIGFCGLFLTAAGGHFAYHTLSAAGMAAVFAFLAFLSHAYAVFRNSRLFFFIGATGGLAAMLFPLAEQDYGTGLAVYVTVTLAGAVVCGMRKWMGLALIGWLSGLVLLVPVIDSAYPRNILLASLYLGSMACIVAYARSHSSTSADLAAIGAGLMHFVTGVIGFATLNGYYGIPHLALFSAFGVAFGLWLPSSGASRCLLIGAAAAGLFLVSLCLPVFWGLLSFVAIVGVALVARRLTGRLLSAAFAMVALVGAIGSYVRWLGLEPTEGEAVPLTALLAGLVLATLVLRAAALPWLSFLVAGVWAFFSRTSFILSPVGELQLQSFSLHTLISVALALLLLILGFRLKSGELRLWSIAVMFSSVIQILVFESDTAVGFRLVALVFLGGMMLVGGLEYARQKQAKAGEPELSGPLRS